MSHFSINRLGGPVEKPDLSEERLIRLIGFVPADDGRDEETVEVKLSDLRNLVEMAWEMIWEVQNG